MLKRHGKKIFISVILLLITTPYIIAFFSGGGDFVFGGFLINPIDGNSYLAKMQQGVRGEWRFQLPYTAEPGEGIFLFLFYIFLGHVCRWVGIDPVFMFAIVRVISSLILYLALYKFMEMVFDEQERQTNRAFYLAGIGSGLGWLAGLFGALTTDLWVPEAYPFFSSYATPHFSLGMALLLWAFVLVLKEKDRFSYIQMAVCGAVLAVVMPFGVVVECVVLVGLTVWQYFEGRIFKWENVFWSCGVGGLIVLWQYWETVTDPVMAGWNAQNLTPAPQIWDLMISFSPALLFAFWGLKKALKNPIQRSEKLLLVWAILGIMLIYTPFSLQRRFIFGLFVPISALAVVGVGAIKKEKQSKLAYNVLLLLSIPTNLFLLLGGFFGIQSHNEKLFLTRDEANVLAWLEDNGEIGSIVLCSPEMGMYVPSYTNSRVLYGHPFETVNAEGEKEAVLDFFEFGGDNQQGADFLIDRDIDYVLFGPREKVLGRPDVLDEQIPVLTQGDVDLYQVSGKK